MTYPIFLVLIVIVAVLLILIIMVQNPKGGGLSSSFGGQGSQSLGGVQNTTNFLDRSTWTLAITLGALILLSNFAIDHNKVDTKSQIEGTLNDRNPVEQTAPVTTEQPATIIDTTNN
ncbi:preprotein translocase subunit SecG [Aureibaculum sp. 2210JD6-5]|uniref:preprotein translocase subunit SecG n=1 Tax=Aureibaculum sp. 2210JD6-5 TaxID=3103957 RepID=UPI002AAE67D3|nr:preprotein translocase subunit SecG [Aureibaculum sp. 2210JD6-5]MDY7395340.1 preprotein translocase subunit SecG [Aureibaculum sp. 2210JD6-5]